MPQTQKPTACLALADGTVFYGQGFGAVGQTEAELCFNTAMSGYACQRWRRCWYHCRHR